jgi:hypothetical protein
VDRSINIIASIAIMALRVSLVFWPAAVIALNRHADEEPGRPTAGEVIRIRVPGTGLVAGGGYGIYALLTATPGAEFFPA